MDPFKKVRPLPARPGGTYAVVKAQRHRVMAEVATILVKALCVWMALPLLLLMTAFRLYADGEPPRSALMITSELVDALRGGMDTSVLIGVPVSVLVPAALVIILEPRMRDEGTGVDVWVEARLEIIGRILSAGLMLGSALALLAAIPSGREAGPAEHLLAIAVALACSLLAVMIGPIGTQRAVIVARRRALRLGVYDWRRRARETVRGQAPYLVRLLGQSAFHRTLATCVICLVTLVTAVLFAVIGVVLVGGGRDGDFFPVFVLAVLVALEALLVFAFLAEWEHRRLFGDHPGRLWLSLLLALCLPMASGYGVVDTFLKREPAAVSFLLMLVCLAFGWVLGFVLRRTPWAVISDYWSMGRILKRA